MPAEYNMIVKVTWHYELILLWHEINLAECVSWIGEDNNCMILKFISILKFGNRHAQQKLI